MKRYIYLTLLSIIMAIVSFFIIEDLYDINNKHLSIKLAVAFSGIIVSAYKGSINKFELQNEDLNRMDNIKKQFSISGYNSSLFIIVFYSVALIYFKLTNNLSSLNSSNIFDTSLLLKNFEVLGKYWLICVTLTVIISMSFSLFFDFLIKKTSNSIKKNKNHH